MTEMVHPHRSRGNDCHYPRGASCHPHPRAASLVWGERPRVGGCCSRPVSCRASVTSVGVTSLSLVSVVVRCWDWKVSLL